MTIWLIFSCHEIGAALFHRLFLVKWQVAIDACTYQNQCNAMARNVNFWNKCHLAGVYWSKTYNFVAFEASPVHNVWPIEILEMQDNIQYRPGTFMFMGIQLVLAHSDKYSGIEWHAIKNSDQWECGMNTKHG